MGKRGPKRTPTAILAKRGSRRADTRTNEPEPRGGVVQPPPGMRKPTRKIWDYFLDSVVPHGVVTQSDAVLFAELCELYEEIGDLRRKLRTQGRSLTTAAGGEKGSPFANQLDKVLSKFYALSSRFGMDPSSRASLNIKDEDLRHKSGRGKKLDDLIRGSSN